MMKNSFILFFLTLCTLQSAVAQYTTETFSSAKLERKQKIGIYKPDNYSDKQAYPLLVVLNANSLMEPTISAVRYYERFQEMPPCIIVGVFDQRLEDVAIIDEVARPMNESARFFEFLATELVPYIQGKYPIAALKGLIASEEAAFLIKVLNKVDINAKKLKRITSFKVYLTNPSLRTALFSPIKESDEEMGNMVETAILAQWMHREKLNLTYARWKEGRKEGEVDLVLIDDKHFKPQWAVEIKWSNRYYQMPQDLLSLMNFCRVNKLMSAIITTKDITGAKTIDEMNFTFISSSIYAYNVGANTLNLKLLQ